MKRVLVVDDDAPVRRIIRHHLVKDGMVAASTPLFLGVDPAVSPLLGGHELRPLGSAEDLGAFNLGSTVVLLVADGSLRPAALGDHVRMGQALWGKA